MNNIKKLIIVVMTLLYACNSHGMTLMSGYSRSKSGVSDTEVTKQMLTIGAYGLEAYIKLPSDDYYYTLMGGVFGRLNLNTSKYLGNIPLTRWPHLVRPTEIVNNHASVGFRQWRNKIEYTARFPYAGCLNQTPLRYGDIDGDGSNEIVLFLNGELIVFSPERQRTIFSAFVQADDLYRESMEGIGHASDVDEGVSYQYLSEYLIYNNIPDKAYRSYTKLYIGDYDEDGNSDIVTWQKIYVSNKVGEAAGFHLVSNELKHFERDLKAQEESPQGITGEYLPQETDENTIKTWLTENNLTWQKGYPDKSECAGEEGKPILEMSDPLLNDPEVLQ